MLRLYFAVVIFPGNFSFGFIAEHWYIILAEWLMIKRLAEMQKHELHQEIQNPELNIYLFCRPWPLFWSTTFCFPHLFKIMRHLRLKWISCHKNSSSCQISWKICQLHVRGSEFGCLWICQHDWCFLPDDIDRVIEKEHFHLFKSTRMYGSFYFYWPTVWRTLILWRTIGFGCV